MIYSTVQRGLTVDYILTHFYRNALTLSQQSQFTVHYIIYVLVRLSLWPRQYSLWLIIKRSGMSSPIVAGFHWVRISNNNSNNTKRCRISHCNLPNIYESQKNACSLCFHSTNNLHSISFLFTCSCFAKHFYVLSYAGETVRLLSIVWTGTILSFTIEYGLAEEEILLTSSDIDFHYFAFTKMRSIVRLWNSNVCIPFLVELLLNIRHLSVMVYGCVND